MLSLQRLTTATAPHFAHLLDPALRPLLNDLDEAEAGLYAVGACFWGDAAGIALAEALAFEGEEHGRLLQGEVLDLYVQPIYRRAQIGTRLLAALEELLCRQGCSEVRLRHQAGEETTPLAHLLQRQGWTREPAPVRLFWTNGMMARAEWVQKSRLPDSYEVIPWHSLTHAEVEQVRQRMAEGGWCPPILSPFCLPLERLQPELSLALRYKPLAASQETSEEISEVVGWVLVTRQEQHSVCYEILFVSPELQPLGRGAQLLAEAIRRHDHNIAHLPGYPTEMVWRVHSSNAPMLRFVQRRMKPWLIQEGEEWEWSKRLRS